LLKTADNGDGMTGRADSQDNPARNAGASETTCRSTGSRKRRRFLVWGALVATLAVCAAVGWNHRFASGPHRLGIAGASLAEKASTARPEIASLILEASDVAERLSRRFPDTPDSLDVMAWLHCQFGMSERAVECWQRCLELDRGFGPAYFQLGIIAQESGESQKAADYFGRALELNPHSSGLPVHLAQALMNLGKLEEAIDVLEQGLQAHPRSMPILALLGDMLVRLERYEEATDKLEEAVKIAPGYASAYYGLFNACARLGEQEKSKEYLEKFKALKEKEERAHRDGLKTLDDVSSVRHRVAKIYTAAAKVYLAHGDPQTAESHLLRAADLSPSDPECLQLLAWLYERQGRTEEAVAALSRAKENDPENVGVHLRLAALHVRQRQFEAAEEAYLKVIQISPHQAGGYAAMAKLYLQANRKLPEAKRLAVKAVDQEPLARNYFLLSLACQKNGDLTGALSAIERAVALDPEHGEYRQMHEQIRQHRER